jgi:hypothetical protein
MRLSCSRRAIWGLGAANVTDRSGASLVLDTANGPIFLYIETRCAVRAKRGCRAIVRPVLASATDIRG